MSLQMIVAMLMPTLALAYSPEMPWRTVRTPPQLLSQRTGSRSAEVLLREPNSASAARERLLPDILNAMDEVSLFIARADASRQRKPAAPSADCIEAYCAKQQRKLDLLMAEAKLLREAEAAGLSPAEAGGKVRWTDIDGNSYNDAAWLKQ